MSKSFIFTFFHSLQPNIMHCMYSVQVSEDSFELSTLQFILLMIVRFSTNVFRELHVLWKSLK